MHISIDGCIPLYILNSAFILYIMVHPNTEVICKVKSFKFQYFTSVYIWFALNFVCTDKHITGAEMLFNCSTNSSANQDIETVTVIILSTVVALETFIICGAVWIGCAFFVRIKLKGKESKF